MFEQTLKPLKALKTPDAGARLGCVGAQPPEPHAIADLLNTNELAQQLGVAASTVRYYRSAGRISPARQTPGGHARWSLEQVRRQLAERPVAANTGLTEEHFAPLGVSDISERGAELCRRRWSLSACARAPPR